MSQYWAEGLRAVIAVEDDRVRFRVHSTGVGSHDADSETFDTVVNALWDGRLAGRGLHPAHQWVYRIKYGIHDRYLTQV